MIEIKETKSIPLWVGIISWAAIGALLVVLGLVLCQKKPDHTATVTPPVTDTTRAYHKVGGEERPWQEGKRKSRRPMDEEGFWREGVREGRFANAKDLQKILEDSIKFYASDSTRRAIQFYDPNSTDSLQDSSARDPHISSAYIEPGRALVYWDDTCGVGYEDEFSAPDWLNMVVWLGIDTATYEPRFNWVDLRPRPETGKRSVWAVVIRTGIGYGQADTTWKMRLPLSVGVQWRPWQWCGIGTEIGVNGGPYGGLSLEFQIPIGGK